MSLGCITAICKCRHKRSHHRRTDAYPAVKCKVKNCECQQFKFEIIQTPDGMYLSWTEYLEKYVKLGEKGIRDIPDVKTYIYNVMCSKCQSRLGVVSANPDGPSRDNHYCSVCKKRVEIV